MSPVAPLALLGAMLAVCVLVLARRDARRRRAALARTGGARVRRVRAGRGPLCDRARRAAPVLLVPDPTRGAAAGLTVCAPLGPNRTLGWRYPPGTRARRMLTRPRRRRIAVRELEAQAASVVEERSEERVRVTRPLAALSAFERRVLAADDQDRPAPHAVLAHSWPVCPMRGARRAVTCSRADERSARRSTRPSSDTPLQS